MSQVAQAERDARNAGSQTYPGYREAEAQWTGKVPKSWKLRKLKYAAKFTPERASEASTHLPYVGLEHIESETGKLLELDEETTPESTVHRFRAGDVLFGKLRPYLAKVWEARQDGDCTSELVVLRPREEVSPSFLHYQLLAPPFIDAVDAQTYGAKMPRVSPQQLGDMYVAVPSQEEQKSIAQFLNIQTSRIDRLIDKKERLIELLEERRTALITKAVTKGLDPDAPMKDSGVEWLGAIPEHWNMTRYRNLITEVTSGSRDWANYYSEDGELFIRVGNLSKTSPKIDVNNAKRVNPPCNSEAERSRIQPGDVLFSITADIGAVGVATSSLGEAYVNQHVALTRPNEAVVLPRWVAYWFLSAAGYSELQRPVYGGTKDGLSFHDLKELQIAVPPQDVQRDIVAILDEEIGKLDRGRHLIEAAVSRLREYRSALITAAVTGKIDVRDHAA